MWRRTNLTAAGGAAAVLALVAVSVGRHQHAALGAGGCAVNRGVRARAGRYIGGARRRTFFGGVRRERRRGRRWRERLAIDRATLRQVIGGDEPPTQPARDVVEHRLGVRDGRVAGVTRGLEARIDELVHQRLERHAILQADGNRQREAVHEPGERGALLGHLDKDLARRAVLVHAHGDVALVAPDGELVRDRVALARQLAAMGAVEQLLLLGDVRGGRGGPAQAGRLAPTGRGFAAFFLRAAAESG